MQDAVQPVLFLRPELIIRGAVISETPVTLEGSVHGSVCISDSYFYESPTHYYGWLRNILLDRSNLPKGFLLSPIFQSATSMRSSTGYETSGMHTTGQLHKNGKLSLITIKFYVLMIFIFAMDTHLFNSRQ
jgi:hypothetical protein